MTDSTTTNYAGIDIDELLRQRKQIAIIWGIEDIQEVRPDLNDDQSWEVLQACESQHDCTIGLSWETIEITADDLFPAPEFPISGREDE